MKILSVDDSSENLYMLEALLRGHGHEVDSASNGLDALRLAERTGYDVIVTDILMPRMDGFQLCRELKHNERLRQIPVIFYTATYTDPKDAALALSLGAARFLTKPLEPETFVKELENVAATAAAQPVTAPDDSPEEESIYLKEYNARLVAKLEKKMLDLEAANKALQEDIDERERAQRERALLESQLRRAQRMEAIGTLAGGIAHDFNNILAGIIGFAEIGLRDLREGRDVSSNFSSILDASHRARELVDQILTFSRQRDQPRTKLDLAEHVQTTLPLVRPTIPATVTLEFKAEAGLPPILAHASHIHQIVSNLVTNAGHAIGSQPGTIRLRVESIDMDAERARGNPDLRPGRYVRLSVSDTGPGIPSGIIDRIFEPFVTTRENGQGTGLGLSVVHGIMKTYDGAIGVESEPGRGTTFHLYFPAISMEPTANGELLPGAHGRGERILFVEDEPVLAILGERFLQRLGYAPTVSTDVADALAKFNERPFDLVITDLAMPMMSGVEFARQLWRHHRDTPVILTTGFSASLDISTALELGFRDLLVKPYEIRALAECVQRALAATRR